MWVRIRHCRRGTPEAVDDNSSAVWPVTINSGCRCATHNEREGGSPKSQHLLGRAADIKVTGVTPREIYEFYDEAFPTGGAHAYETFTHVDTRNHRARW
jgi:uncharacterized protein YcbK (DUF882 family)